MAAPEDQPPSQEKAVITANIGVNQQIVQRVNTNVTDAYLLVGENKVRLVLYQAMQSMELADAWKFPLGIFIVVVFATTSSFQDFLVSKDTWRGIFIVSGALSLFYLLKSLLRRKNSMSIDDIIREFRTQPPAD